MPASQDEITVTRNDDEHRYEVYVGETLAGFTEFSLDARGRHRYPHTEVDPAFRGRGLAGIVIGEAMADSARRGETVVPLCPVVARYLGDNEIPGLDVHWPSRVSTP
ncbi:GNAT family N-acetyltransferase [Microbacterium yannicii]|uniref:GNAT family N-acetyltransferase n=1 Tax=Microbacterium yannicii TaxID=671622 RepID=UPI0002D851F4|nr:GNAT family N-acetyltransferase [Microbacterium yannicii]